LQFRSGGWQFSLKLLVKVLDFLCAWKVTARDVGEPITRFSYNFDGVILMNMDICSSDIRHELYVAISLKVKDERTLPFLGLVTKFFCAKKYAKLKRHVEAWQTIFIVKFSARDIVNAETTLPYQSIDFVEAQFAIVGEFFRRSRSKSTSENRKKQSLKKLSIVWVERTVYKYVIDRRQAYLRQRYFLDELCSKAVLAWFCVILLSLPVTGTNIYIPVAALRP
jgi:hypothetical protein